MKRQRLGLLVATDPDEGDFACIHSAIAGALGQGADVGVFLMDDGVRYALDARLQALLSVGVELTLCATDAAARALPCDELEALGVVIGSQHDHARLVRDSDRFLSFT